MKYLPVFGMGLLRIIQSTFNKQASAYTDTTSRNLRFGAFFEMAAAIFSLVYFLIAGISGNVVTTLICAGITGIGFMVELLTALAAMRRAPLVLCTLCSLGGGIILPAIAGIFFFEEPMTLVQWGGVALFFIAALLLSPKEEPSDTKKVHIGKAFPVLIANFFINGFISTVAKYYAVKVADGNAAMYACFSYGSAAIAFGIVLLIMRFSKPAPQKDPFPKKVYLFGAVLGATCASIVYLNTVLSRSIPIVILSTIPNAVCIAGCLFLGYWLFKEKLTVIRVIGAALSILSTILIIIV